MGFGVLEGLAAGLGGLAPMMSIPAHPFWSLALLAIDVLVIYGLAAYGGKPYLTR